MRRLPELPRAIYIGHLISWFAATILFIIGITDLVKYHNFDLVEVHYIILYQRPHVPLW